MGPLVDTSVLIDYFAGTNTREADALEECFAKGIPPATAPIILQEFLQGFSRAADLDMASLYLSQFERLSPPDYAAHQRASSLHRALRKAGHTTPTIAALIVEIARRDGLPLLTSDAHQRRLARVAEVELA